MNATQIGVLAAVAGGGAVGALLRFGLSASLNSGAFPWGTMAVNLSGCFVAGLLVAAALRPGASPVGMRAFLLTGVLGGFTTLSTFSLDTLELLAAGRWAAGCANLAVNGVGSLGAAALGVVIGAAVAAG